MVERIHGLKDIILQVILAKYFCTHPGLLIFWFLRLEYAVNSLKVQHIIICGHYGCGGIKYALESDGWGMIDHWMRSIRDVYRIHIDEVELSNSLVLVQPNNTLTKIGFRLVFVQVKVESWPFAVCLGRYSLSIAI